jgi:protein-disulfide isomerase
MVSQTQVEEAYSENKSAFGAMSPDEAKERLQLDLESQARMQNYLEAVSKFKQAAKIELLLQEPRLAGVVEDNSPSIGSKQALITIIEFSDFQCPFCRNSQEPIRHVLQTYTDKVRLIFRHRPLETHSEAFLSAQAAFCAGEQGVFWEYHDALFASETLSSQILNKLASNLGLDISRFGNCLKSDRSRIAVLNDLNEAVRLGINSTPTFVINGRLFRGALSFEVFKDVIEQELRGVPRASPNK